MIAAGRAEWRDLLLKPRILQKGLAAVLLPLTMQTVWLLALGYMWSSAEQLAARERHQIEITSALSQVTATRLSAVTYFVIYSGMGGGIYKRDAEKFSVDLKTYQDNLERLCAGDPAKLPLLKQLQADSNEELSGLVSMPEGSGWYSIKDLQNLKSGLIVGMQHAESEARLMEEQLAALQVSRIATQESRTRLKYAIYVGLAANFLAALVLAVLFNNDIVKRLAALAQNSARLSRREQLLPTVPGNDEIAYLDATLHEAATALEEAEQQRQTIIEMVAHDMRSPLMSAQVSTEIIEEVTAGKIAPNATEKLNTVRNSCGDVLNLLNTFLLIQRHESERTEGGGQTKESSRVDPAMSRLQAAAHQRSHAMTTPDQAAASENTARQTYARRRSTIPQRGLALVLIPLVVSTIWMVLLSNRMQAMEDLVDAQGRQNTILMKANMMLSRMMGMQAALCVFLITQSGRDRMRAMDFLDAFHKETASMLAQTSPNSVERALTADTTQTCDEFFARQIGMKEVPKNKRKDFLMSRFQNGSIFYNRLMLNQRAFERHFAGGATRLEESRKEQEAMHDRILLILAAGILSNFLLALLLVWLFNKQISKRLAVLVDNAQRLPGLLPLKQPLSGDDELASLDAVLHTTHDRLAAAADERQNVMTLMADSMRAPLAKAQFALGSESETISAISPAMGHKHVLAALSNLDRILRLLDELLTLETVKSGKIDIEKSHFEVEEVFEATVASLSAMAKVKQVEIETAGGGLAVSADRHRLIQLMVNYLSNAIKFAPENSTITLCATSLSDAVVRLSVADRGPGMDETTRTQLFERFYQASTDQKKVGFGLGLAICRLIAEAHGGSAGVDSTVGSGSTFWADLPILNRSKPQA